jgi:hypothetical protein
MLSTILRFHLQNAKGCRVLVLASTHTHTHTDKAMDPVAPSRDRLLLVHRIVPPLRPGQLPKLDLPDVRRLEDRLHLPLPHPLLPLGSPRECGLGA